MTVNFAAVREHHPLATVARRTGYVLPEPRGDVFVACPMAGHEDSTPSMLLHLDEDRYHCFGCGASGDVLQWVRDVYGVDARSALAMLDASNDRCPDPPSGAVATMRSEVRQQHRSDQPDLTRTPAGRVKDALAAAWAYYTLPRLAEKAAAYLADRGIDVSGLGDVAGFDGGGARQGVKPGDRLHQAPAPADVKGSAHRCGHQHAAVQLGFAVTQQLSAGLHTPRRPGVAPDQFDQRVIIDPLSSVQR